MCHSSDERLHIAVDVALGLLCCCFFVCLMGHFICLKPQHIIAALQKEAMCFTVHPGHYLLMSVLKGNWAHLKYCH